MTLRIATWNVNSIKVRLGHLLDWLGETNPDVVLLQEIKVDDDKFPALEIEDAGYNVEVHGQKTYHGVAMLSKRPMDDVVRGLPGDDSDDQARYLEATVSGVRIASLYLPNGNPVDTDKFTYKLRWMERLRDRARELLRDEETFVLGGDYNILPGDEDVWDPEAFAGSEQYISEMKRFVSHVKSSRRLPGVEVIRLPGERAFRSLRQTGKNGIPLSNDMFEKLNSIARENGVEGI